jgi:hypothetical protein
MRTTAASFPTVLGDAAGTAGAADDVVVYLTSIMWQGEPYRQRRIPVQSTDLSRPIACVPDGAGGVFIPSAYTAGYTVNGFVMPVYGSARTMSLTHWNEFSVVDDARTFPHALGATSTEAVAAVVLPTCEVVLGYNSNLATVNFRSDIAVVNGGAAVNSHLVRLGPRHCPRWA